MTHKWVTRSNFARLAGNVQVNSFLESSLHHAGEIQFYAIWPHQECHTVSQCSTMPGAPEVDPSANNLDIETYEH